MSKEKMIADLKRSGLTKTDMTKMKLKVVSQKEMSVISKKRKAAYEIPYFNIQGKPSNFCRYKYLEEVKNRKGKVVKYHQVFDSEPRLYFPPSVSWKQIASDPSIPIVITEGEKKAAKACKEGIMCIGLGGVWSFRSTKLNKALIDDFKEIQWSGRSVRIIYDSDALQNDLVALAAQKLATELNGIGAKIFIGCVPEIERGEKCGLDDYLLVRTRDNLYASLKEMPFERGACMLQMNSDLSLIKDTAGYFVDSTSQIYKRQEMLNLYEEFNFIEQVGEAAKEFNAAKEWCKWPQRRTYNSLSYQPGKDKEPGDNTLNTWSGWGHEPDKGNVKPFYELLDFIFKGDDDKPVKEWFLKWAAYPIQYPGTKLNTSVLLWSLEQGTGKTFVGEILGEIYGMKNYKTIGHAELHGSFNDWAANKQFIVGDEITSSSKWADNDKLKSVITQTSITINQKFKPVYTVQDCINYLFTSNHPDAMFVEASDRRIMVHEITGKKLSDAFYAKVDKWKNNGGLSALHHHLLNDIDCTGFNPKAEAIHTDSKEEMKQATMTDVDLFIQELKLNPGEVLMHGNIQMSRDLYTAKDLAELFNFSRDFDFVKDNVMGRALKKAGFIKTKMMRVGKTTRQFYIIRNVDKWAKIYDRGDMKKMVQHYDELQKVTPISQATKFKKGGDK